MKNAHLTTLAALAQRLSSLLILAALSACFDFGALVGPCQPNSTAPGCVSPPDIACEEPDDCIGSRLTTVCQGGRCRSTATGKCNSTVNCASGLECNSGSCKEPMSMMPDMGTVDPKTCQNEKNCAPGAACTDQAQCLSGICETGTCRAKLTETCKEHNECQASLTCGPNKTCQASGGAACTDQAQCLSGICKTGTCRGKVGDGCTTAATDCDDNLICPSGTRKCTVPTLPKCTVGTQLDGPTNPCGGDQTNTVCSPLDKCGVDRYVSKAADCDLTKAPMFAGNPGGKGVCAVGVKQYMFIQNKGDATKVSVIATPPRTIADPADGSFYTFNDTEFVSAFAANGGDQTTTIAFCYNTKWNAIGKGESPAYVCGGPNKCCSSAVTPP